MAQEMNNPPPPPPRPPPAPGPIRFPPRPPPEKILSLRRRLSLEPSQDSVEARKSINAIMAATRAPWGEQRTLDSQQVADLQKSLRLVQVKLEERERVVAETAARLADQERELAETSALLAAREKVFTAAKGASRAPTLSKDEQSAVEQLKAELERQAVSIKEQKAALKDREAFIEENEAKLFEKMQTQQEQEVELEQKFDDLQAMEKRLREKEAALDPAAAAALKAERQARKFDEFNE
jgi:chromosome segregation ATPase